MGSQDSGIGPVRRELPEKAVLKICLVCLPFGVHQRHDLESASFEAYYFEAYRSTRYVREYNIRPYIYRTKSLETNLQR